MTQATMEWADVPKRFAIHIVVGTFMFLVAGAGAVVLHLFVEWLAQMELPHWMISISTWIEYALFGGDVALFGIYIVRTVLYHGMKLLTTKVG